MYWAGLLSILSSLVNVGLVGLKQWDLSRPSVPVFPPLELEFASSYVGLERAYHDPSAPMPAPVTNAPTAIGVVNTAAPQTVYHDTHHLTTTFGTVYPDDRRILLSPTVSVGFYTFKYHIQRITCLQETTFVQFWAGDYGMERCSLEFRLPTLRDALVTLEGDSTVVEAWIVDSAHSLDLSKLSWDQRPKRDSLLTSWILRPNVTIESAEFSCVSGSYQTFELACASEGCHVDFRQNPKKTSLGGL